MEKEETLTLKPTFGGEMVITVPIIVLLGLSEFLFVKDSSDKKQRLASETSLLFLLHVYGFKI